MALFRKEPHLRSNQEVKELTAPAVRRLATGKIDGCSRPRSSLVRHLRFRASALVNTDCGKRVLAPSPDTSRCAGAHGHDRLTEIDAFVRGSSGAFKSALAISAIRSAPTGRALAPCLVDWLAQCRAERKPRPTRKRGAGSAFARQYSSANMIVSTRVTTGSPFEPLTSGSSYKSILKNTRWPSASNAPKSCSSCGSLA